MGTVLASCTGRVSGPMDTRVTHGTEPPLTAPSNKKHGQQSNCSAFHGDYSQALRVGQDIGPAGGKLYGIGKVNLLAAALLSFRLADDKLQKLENQKAHHWHG